MNALRSLLCLLLISGAVSAAEPDWPRVEQHAIELLQEYVRIRSINPPADTRQAAHFLETNLPPPECKRACSRTAATAR